MGLCNVKSYLEIFIFHPWNLTSKNFVNSCFTYLLIKECCPLRCVELLAVSPDPFFETPPPRSSQSKLRFPWLTVFSTKNFNSYLQLDAILLGFYAWFIAYNARRVVGRSYTPMDYEVSNSLIYASYYPFLGHQGHQQLLRPVPAPLPIHFRINDGLKPLNYLIPHCELCLLVKFNPAFDPTLFIELNRGFVASIVIETSNKEQLLFSINYFYNRFRFSSFHFYARCILEIRISRRLIDGLWWEAHLESRAFEIHRRFSRAI